MGSNRSRKSSFSLLSGDPKTRRNKRRSATTWISDIMEILRDFKENLSRYDLVWEAFNRQAIDCFIDAEPSKLNNYVEAIEMSFGELRGFLRTVEGMIKELAQDYPQGVCLNRKTSPIPEIDRLIKTAPWSTPPRKQ